MAEHSNLETNVKDLDDNSLIRLAFASYAKASLIGCSDEIWARAQELKAEVEYRLEHRHKVLVDELNNRLAQRAISDNRIQTLQEVLDYYPSL